MAENIPEGLYRVTGCRSCDESPTPCSEHTYQMAQEAAEAPEGKGWQTPAAADLDAILDESGLTPEVVELMREGRYLTANRCPICKVGHGRWCRGLAAGKVHAERLDNIERKP